MLLTALGVLFLYNWTAEAVGTAHIQPLEPQGDMGEIIEMVESGDELSETGIQFLAGQTGLGATAIEKLILTGREQELFAMQSLYFAPVIIEEFRTTPITVSEWLAEEPIPGYGGMPMVDIQKGDILITKNSRFLGWRNGHAGLVVDAEKALVLEAIMLGNPSQLCRIDKWEKYPSFLVLRLREEFEMLRDADRNLGNTMNITEGDFTDDTLDTTKDTTSKTMAEDIADYASQHLVGVPYQLLAGVWEEETLSGTQCAHLVWYAYKQFGIDLDSDGGLFVTPYDIQNSPYLEVVQSYGY